MEDEKFITRRKGDTSGLCNIPYIQRKSKNAMVRVAAEAAAAAFLLLPFAGCSRLATALAEQEYQPGHGQPSCAYRDQREARG